MSNEKLALLTPNDLKILDKVVKNALALGERTDIPFEEVLALAIERHATRQQGGARKGAGRPARVWSDHTHHSLPTLPLRIVIEQSLRPLSDKEAFRHLLLHDLSNKNFDKLFEAYQRAIKAPREAELERHRKERELRRRRRAEEA